MRCRARDVFTKASQSRLGFCFAEVMTSTVSPFLSFRERGAMRPFTLAPAQWRPTSVWTAKAKSMGRGARGELLHVALGGEDEDLALEEVHPEELHELLRLAGVLLPLQDLPEPVQGLVDLVVPLGLAVRASL